MMVPELLRNRLARRQCVVYVGAGFSMACGMPGWLILLKRLLEYAKKADVDDTSENRKTLYLACENALENGEYIIAASIIRKLLSPGDLDECVQQQFGNHVLIRAEKSKQKQMYERLNLLVNSPWAGIVTTNYDMLIEFTLGKLDREIKMSSGDDPRLGIILALPEYQTFFVKLHGSLSGSSIVLSTEEYDRTYLATPKISIFLTTLMLRYHIIFIGCSLEDEIVRLRRKISFDFDKMIPMAYALLPYNEYNLS